MYPLALLAACSRKASSTIHRGKAGGEKIVRLPDVTLEVLNMYEVYLDCWDFRQIHAPDRCTRESNLKDKHAEYMLFIDLYKLGCGKLDDVKLRNYAALEMSKTLESCEVLPEPTAFAVVWSIEPHGDFLRKLLVDFVVAIVDREDLGKRLGQYPIAFVHELALAALRKSATTVWQPRSSQYFEPEKSEDDTLANIIRTVIGWFLRSLTEERSRDLTMDFMLEGWD